MKIMIFHLIANPPSVGSNFSYGLISNYICAFYKTAKMSSPVLKTLLPPFTT